MADIYGAPPGGLSGDYYGGHPLGVLAEEVPSGGSDGPGYLYPGLSLPADIGKRVRGPISRWPAGVLTVQPSSAFDYVGAADYALYPLYVDGVASTTDIGYGAGIGRIDLNVGLTGGALSGSVQLGPVVAAGSLGVEIDGDIVSETSLRRYTAIESRLGLAGNFDGTDPDRPTVTKDTDALLDYVFDWSRILTDVEDAIASFSFELADGAQIVAQGQLGDLVAVWVSSGAPATTVALTSRITTVGGRADERTLYLRIVER